MKKLHSFGLALLACSIIGCGCGTQAGTALSENTQPVDNTEYVSENLNQEINSTPEAISEISESTEGIEDGSQETENTQDSGSAMEETTAAGNAGPELDPEKEVQITLQDLEKLPKEIHDIIYGDGTFYDIEERKEFTKAGYQLTRKGGELSSGVIWEEFNVADVDQDGEYELFVYLSVPEGDFELNNEIRIFDLSEGTVYAHPSWFRAVEDIYENGVVSGSSGANAASYYLFSFDGEKASEIDIMHTEMENTAEAAERGDFTAYFIGEEKVSAEDFDAYYQEYMKGAREQRWCNDAL